MGKKKKKDFEGFRKSEKSPYKTIKTTLKSLLRDKEILPCINNLVYELNDLVIHSIHIQDYSVVYFRMLQ